MIELRAVAYCEALFAPLLAEAAGEGHAFLARLRDEWQSGVLRFERPGEILLGAFGDGRLIGIGGISHDPYAPAPGLARLRHLYVLRTSRGLGIGSILVARLLEHASADFHVVRLSTDSAEAARLYERLGFERCQAPRQSHRIVIGPDR